MMIQTKDIHFHTMKVYLGSFEGQHHQEYLPQDLSHKYMIDSNKKK